MTPLKDFQLVGAKLIRAFDGCALLADEMGLGKSIQVLYWCFKMRRTRPVIIVCPASLKWNWEREAMHHLGMAAEVLNGRKPPKRGHFRVNHLPILIINYEILDAWIDYLVALKPKVLIFDEAHYIQNRLSLRFKALKRLVDEAQIPYRIALTGTPLTNRPAELWTTLNVLRPEVYVSFVEFCWKYTTPKMVRGKWEFLGARNTAELHAELKMICMIRRLKKDVAKELPEKIREIVVLDLPNRKEYDYAVENFLQWVREEFGASRAIKAGKQERLTKVGYLLRLVVKLKRHMVLEWIENFLAESDEKLVFFSMHSKMIHWLYSHFEESAVIIDGTVTGRSRQEAVDAFQTNRHTRLSLCNPRAAGVGITMHAASNVCYGDFPWTPGTLKQGEDRVHRIGQTKQCYIWFLAARLTIEEKLCNLLGGKQEILDQVLDGLESGNDFNLFSELLSTTNEKQTKRPSLRA